MINLNGNVLALFPNAGTIDGSNLKIVHYCNPAIVYVPPPVEEAVTETDVMLSVPSCSL